MRRKNVAQTNNAIVIAIITTVSVKTAMMKIKTKKFSVMRKIKKADTTEAVRAIEAARKRNILNINRSNMTTMKRCLSGS